MFTIGGLVLAIAVAVGFIVLSQGAQDLPDVPKGTIYYTGPMKSKGGGQGYGTVDGRSMSKEEAQAEIDQWVKQNLGSNSK